jgi:hypothetical protein
MDRLGDIELMDRVTAVTPETRRDILPSLALVTLGMQDSSTTRTTGASMDRVPDSELMPLCAAAAIAWGYAVDYPSLKLDSAQFEQQMQHMEALLQCLVPVYGEDPRKVRKSDLYQAIKGLRAAPLKLDWWAVQQKKPPETPPVYVHFHFAAGLRRAA